MKLKEITINNFRNYDKLNLKFASGLNIIYGKNGVGKTNLVEAIYLLSLTKSFRINNDKILINYGKVQASVEGDIEKNNDTSTYKVILSNEGKKVEINHNKVDKISDYVSKINVILFNPMDINIITSSPSERRNLLNIEISQIYKEYLIILSNYNKILKQRNFYLRQLYINGNSSVEYLEILTTKLIEYGLRINQYRQSFVDKINKYISKIYQDIFVVGDLKVKYVSSYNKKNAQEILAVYKKYYSKEMACGKTLLGVHHDDLVFTLDNHPLKECGSEGQRKNAILSFKLAELVVIKEIKENYPILILDDLFSELDKEKINNILSLLNNEVQTFITTTEINRINKKILKSSKLFHCLDGKMEEEV